ncbi:alpha/beta hydrolase [Blastococcus saxobsidens]|uniref:Alpha/beta hydrolase family protein n=1 Tax=Blastococcus saxobsidens TaxID=138336 RepID=A0A4Q7Y586_9ACTN|nr:alpha/beta hydrolase [Blastococcus saxobsidens]RZU31584.1 alpha/beta hydrolase family protein [Blastococcus saxobsidens]
MSDAGNRPAAEVEDRSVLTLPAPPPDVVLSYGPDPDHVADVRFPRAPRPGRPVVVVLHGGFWRPQIDRMNVRPMTAALAEAGWATVAPEYRRVPGRPDLTVEDVQAAVRAVAVAPELDPLPDRRVVLAGHSAGGHLALLAATTLGPDAPLGILGLAPVADLGVAEQLGLGDGAVGAFLGRDAAARPDLDPARLPAPTGAVRIVHGTADGIVPIEVSEAYLVRHPHGRLVAVPGGHFAVIDPRTGAWAAVLTSLDELGVGADRR